MSEEKEKRKTNMQVEKTAIPEQKAADRVKNFTEVALGYTLQDMINEADRCLECKKPTCIAGCPVEVDIPGFIGALRRGDYRGASRILKSTNSLPAICGRVCPQETQCEEVCVVGKKRQPVGIGRLERWAADWELQNGVEVPEIPPSNGIKVAVVGSGPAGLTCAGDLAKMGYEVTMFEAFHDTGGVLRYGIPEFRLPKAIVDREVNYVKSLGVKLELNVVVGKTYSLECLFKQEGFSAIFLGTGAGLPNFMNVPGENYNGVYSANEFLTRVNLMKGYLFPEYDTPVWVGNKVAVVGAGNVAMDGARVAKRLGAKEVYIVYRRSRTEMPARIEEIHHAEEEGIILKLLTAPTEVLGDDKGWVKGMTCIEMELGEPDASGRRRPVPKAGSEYFLDVDTVIVAIGQTPNPLVPQSTPGLKTGKWGNIEVDPETMMTSVPGVFAGGDAVTGAATVIEAMGAGKKAARGIQAYIAEKRMKK
jgi:glutamate synthase (NADPH/NADH) small chain